MTVDQIKVGEWYKCNDGIFRKVLSRSFYCCKEDKEKVIYFSYINPNVSDCTEDFLWDNAFLALDPLLNPADDDHMNYRGYPAYADQKFEQNWYPI